jgi:hypothetical protein
MYLQRTEFNLKSEDPDCNGCLSLGSDDSTFTDNRKLVLSLLPPSLSPLCHLPQESYSGSSEAGP